MGRHKKPWSVPKKPSTDPNKHNAPWSCKWWETVTDKDGTHDKQRTKWFKTRKLAIEWGKQKEHERLYSDIRKLTDTERAEYLHFKLECEARGLTTKQVFSAGMKHFRIDRFKEISLEDCIECFAIYRESRGYASKTVKGEVNNAKWMMRQTDPVRNVSSFTANELIAIVQMRYPNHRGNQTSFLKDLRNLFIYAAEQGNCSPTIHKDAFLPDAGQRKSKKEQDAERAETRKARFTTKQIKKAFAAVDPRYHQLLALGIFAGLRPESELMQIEWEKEENGHFYGVDFEERIIHIHKTWCSKMLIPRRITDLPDIFWKIMERVPEKERTGRISPVNYRNMRISVYDPIKKVMKWNRWPSDIMRHTALSFQFVLLGAEITQNNAGHKDHSTFQEHYNNAVSGKEAQALLTLNI